MAHFAKISEENEVLQVLTIDDSFIKNNEGNEVESIGQAYLETHNNWPAHLWIQTSYRTSQNKHSTGDDSKAFRGNYAGIGYIWDAENNIFWLPKPYPSWVKDTTTAKWQSPIGEAPDLTAEQLAQNDAGTHSWQYSWNESTQAWDLTNNLA